MKISKIFAVVLACALIAIACCSCVSHIEDTNGDDDFSLTTLTEEQIIKDNSSITNKSKSNQLNGKIDMKADKFSGVKQLKRIKLDDSTKKITADVSVTAGNFRMVLIKDGKIVYDFDINGTSSTTISASGSYLIKIAGESASFNLSLYIE